MGRFIKAHACLLIALLSTGIGASDLKDKRDRVENLTADINQYLIDTEAKYRATKERLSDSPFLCQGRLTTESGVPISTSDRANQSTIYFTPYFGERISLYTGTTWSIYVFTERSLVLSGLTANKNYDVFIYDNSGTLTLELSAAWSTNIGRTDALVKQDGVYVKSGSTTRRWLGTIRTTSTTQTQDTATQRFVWNFYNRVRRYLSVPYTANSWNYSTLAWRAQNADTTVRAEYVTGENEVPCQLRTMVVATSGSTAVRSNISIAFGLDTVGQPDSITPRGGAASNAIRQQLWAERNEFDGLGYHFLQAIEYGDSTVAFYGDDGGDVRLQSGMIGWIDA